MEEISDDSVPPEVDESMSFVELELEALQSIYINEIDVQHDDEPKSTCISIDLHPATADKLDEQYVRMTLKFTLNEEYPQSVPGICIRNPRGLSDEKLNGILQDLQSLAESKVGNSMLFEIIEAAKEHLTVGNRPCGECAICLYGFNEDDVFTRTQCYHYFHSHCLARYAKTSAPSDASEKESHSNDKDKDGELLCPMCRVPLEFDGSEELYPPPSAGEEACVIGEELLEIQQQMADLYQKQLEKGGIIDIEAEKNKYLLEISNVPTRVNSAEKAVVEEVDSSDTLPQTEENVEPCPRTFQKDKAQHAKDVQSNSNAESKNAGTRYKEKPRNERYEKKQYRQPNHKTERGNFSRPGQRYNKHSDSNAQNYENRNSSWLGNWDADVEGETSSKDASGDPCEVPSAESGTSNFYPYKRNERRNNSYSAPRRYNNNNDGYGRGNYYKNPDSSYNKGRRGFANAYQRNDRRERGYQGRRRFNSTTNDNSQQDANNFENGGKPKPESLRCDEKHECPEETASNVSGKNDEFDDPPKSEQSFGRTQSDVPQEERVRYSERKGYSRDDNSGRNSYKNPRRNSYRNSYDHSYGENMKNQGQRRDGHQNDVTDRYSNSYREGKPQFQRNTGYQEANSGRSSYRNSRQGNWDRRENYDKDDVDQLDDQLVQDKKQFPNRNHHSEENESGSPRNGDSQENSSGRNSYKSSYGKNSQQSRDRRGNRYIQKNFNDPDRSKDNSHFQHKNPGYEGNRGRGRYNHERPAYRNERDSYQYRNNPSRRYNSGKYSNSPFQNGIYSENNDSELSNTKPSSENNVDMNNFNLASEIALETEENPSILRSNEPPCKEENDVPVQEIPDTAVSGVAPIACSESNPRKMLPPPPGFSNPLRKVVYGLKAANPPPGFPRS